MNKLILYLCLFIASQSYFEIIEASEPQTIEYIAYYGEISESTGRVRGYYRKDGTYVEGYYRS